VDIKELKNNIEALGNNDKWKWYQIVDFENGVFSPGQKGSGDQMWKIIRNYFPKSLDKIKILDIGCNSGIICVRASLEGASCVGVDEHEVFMRQAEFVKKYFEEKYNRVLDVTYIKDDVMNVLDRLPNFDFVLGMSVFYYIPENKQVEFIEKICKKTNNVIARYRKDMKKFTEYFSRFGFVVKDVIDESRIGRNIVYYKKI
jgi:2-polyprenyl-3-methyl-5-hydroxy-6-metoxy-1,4-benzoquinol methylase